MPYGFVLAVFSMKFKLFAFQVLGWSAEFGAEKYGVCIDVGTVPGARRFLDGFVGDDDIGCCV